MPKIITIAHQKGGVGKTTLALFIYHYFASNDVNCVLVDADPQKSIANLYNTVGQAEDWGDLKLLDTSDFSLKELNKVDADFLIVDTPPAYVNILDDVFKYSDFILIPCKASPLDILAVDETITQLKKTQKTNPNLKAAIVMNQIIPRTKFVETAEAILKEKYDIPVLSTRIHNRADISSYLMSSLSINTERNKKAEQEIQDLVYEIINFLK